MDILEKKKLYRDSNNLRICGSMLAPNSIPIKNHSCIVNYEKIDNNGKKS